MGSRSRRRTIEMKNDMNVWSDDDKSTVTSTTTFNSISCNVHSEISYPESKSCNVQSDINYSESCTVYSKYSNSDSDFEETQSSLKSSVSSKLQKRSICKHEAKVKSSTKHKRLSLRTKSTPTLNKIDKNLQTKSAENIQKSKKRFDELNIASVNLPVNKSIKNKEIQRKTHVVRNIFSTHSSKKDTENISTQTEPGHPQAQQNTNETPRSTRISHRCIQVQTEQENTIQTSTITTSTLKRPHNVATQTDNQLITTEQNKEDEPVKKKVTIIQLNSPNSRLQTIHEECTLLRAVEQHINKLEAVKLNLSQSLNQACMSNNNNENYFENETSNRKNKINTTPLKQLTITESFGKKIDNIRIFRSPSKSPLKENTPKNSPIKGNTPKKSPLKGNTPKKTPEKKDIRYSLESHNRLYENVKKIINWVVNNAHFSILFTKPETDLLKKLLNFEDKNVAVMCLRLYTRQHKWYNFKTLCEELHLSSKSTNLKEFHTNLTNGFVSSDYSKEKIEDLLDYLNLPDIKEICNSFKIRAASRKKVLIDKLLEYSKTQCTLSSFKNAQQILMDRIKKKLGICIKMEMNLRDLLYRIHLLYSLCNPELETANDIYNLMYKIQNGIVKYPTVKQDSANIFSTRQDFLKYAEAMILRKEFYDQYEKKNISGAYFLCVEAFNRLKTLLSEKSQIRFHKSKPRFMRQFSAAWVYCKVLTFGSQHLGKDFTDEVCTWLKEMLKQDVYCTRHRGCWHLQLALVTKTYQKDVNGEAQNIIDGLSDKYVNEVQKHELSIRGSKIRNGKVSKLLYDQLQCLILPSIEVPLIRTIQANVVHNNERGRKLQFVRTTEEGKEYSSVEQTAINHYTEELNFTQGIHCEGQLLDALFIILFYDIIYNTHIPNTFITELQTRPLDLFSAEFYSNRCNQIKSRLEDIKDMTTNELCEFASAICDVNTEELKSLINFDFLEDDTFQIIIKCIGNNVLAATLERFAKDYKQFHSGLPDLFLWNSNDFTCCFVEVKSEKDKLSTKQLLWINYLHSLGAKVEVCHVEHIGSTSTKKIKKT